MTIDAIALWHKRARPNPDERALNVQLGCHLEEVAEMLQTLAADDARSRNRLATLLFQILTAADALKAGEMNLYIDEPIPFIDSIADQVVTAIGVAHCANMKAVEAIDIVNSSNWSKFDENGTPYFDANGKVKKGPRYNAPDLRGCV